MGFVDFFLGSCRWSGMCVSVTCRQCCSVVFASWFVSWVWILRQFRPLVLRSWSWCDMCPEVGGVDYFICCVTLIFAFGLKPTSQAA